MFRIAKFLFLIFISYFFYLVDKKGRKTVAKCGDITCGMH